MIFRIRTDGENLDSRYNKKREHMKQFIRIVLGVFLDTRSSKINNQSWSRELDALGKSLITANAEKRAKSFLALVDQGKNSDIENRVNYDDLHLCVDKFLEEESLVPGKEAGQLRSLFTKLNKFDPEAGYDAEKSDSYGVYEKKIGLIFFYFDLYIKDNKDFLLGSKNAVKGMIDESNDDNGEYKKGSVRENVIGKEETYNFHSVLNLPREIYENFFEFESDKKKAKRDFVKLYNIYMRYDMQTYKQSRGESLLLGKRIKLTDEEIESMEELIDYGYLKGDIMDLSSSYDDILMVLEELMRSENREKQEIISDFFTLLVKANYKLKVSENPYFNNFDLFRTAKITGLNDFVKAVESTGITRNEYSEFPLLKDHSLNYVVGFEKKKSKADKGAFEKSITQVNHYDNSLDNKSVEEKLDRRLIRYLEDIVNLESDVEGEWDKEVVEGINRDTVNSEDIKLALKVLGRLERKASLKEQIIEYGAICDLLNWQTSYSILDMNQSPEILSKVIHNELRGQCKLDKEGNKTILNKVRLNNLWKLLRNCSLEILEMKDNLNESTITNQEDFLLNTKYGVKYWKFKGFEIPRVESDIKSFFIRVFGVRVTILNKEFTRGSFVYIGQEFEATVDGVRPMYESSNREQVSSNIINIMREVEAVSGVDSRYDADSILDWALPSSKKEKPTKKIKEQEQPIDREEFFKSISISSDEEDMEGIDLIF